MADQSSVVYLEIGADGLPENAPPNTIIIGPNENKALCYVDENGDVFQMVTGDHNHDERYYDKPEMDEKIQQLNNSFNYSLELTDQRITTVETTLSNQIGTVNTQLTNQINTVNSDLTSLINVTKTDLESQIGVVDNRLTIVQSDLEIAVNNKKDDFLENSAFNKNFGTTPGTVAEGDHTHPSEFNVVHLNGVDVMMMTDSVRGFDVSVETCTFTFAESSVSTYEWMKIGRATDSDSGFVMPNNGVIVGVSAHCENGKNREQYFDLYVDNSDTRLFQFPSGSGNVEVDDMTKTIPFSKGQKLRVRAGNEGSIDDTVINLFVKWRP